MCTIKNKICFYKMYNIVHLSDRHTVGQVNVNDSVVEKGNSKYNLRIWQLHVSTLKNTVNSYPTRYLIIESERDEDIEYWKILYPRSVAISTNWDIHPSVNALYWAILYCVHKPFLCLFN